MMEYKSDIKYKKQIRAGQNTNKMLVDYAQSIAEY